jgi:ankyrin repeat protein
MSAKSLIDAGADPTARDEQGRNMLHLILMGLNNEALTLPNLFKAMSELLDPELIKELATQKMYRASVHDGWGLKTPLAEWLQRVQDRQADMLQTILEVTGGKDLYVMDGLGNYPIHHVVRKDFVKLAGVMLKFDPTFVQLENATGVTPLELSESKLTRSQLVHSSEISSNIFQRRPCINQHNMLRTHENTLNSETAIREEEYNKDYDPAPFSSLKSKGRQMWELLRDVDLQNPTKRKLVSLQDANQLVERLASKRWKRARADWEGAEPVRTDESCQWRSSGESKSFEVVRFEKEAEEEKKRKERN